MVSFQTDKYGLKSSIYLIYVALIQDLDTASVCY